MAGKHHVFTQAPKDPNGEVRKRTKIAKGPCRKRSNDHILRAEKFGDLITADHKILNEEGESRNNQRYAVIFARCGHSVDTKLPMPNKNFTRRDEKLAEVPRCECQPEGDLQRKFFGIGKACECLEWNHFTSTSHRSQTNGIAE